MRAGHVMRRALERKLLVQINWSGGEDISSTGVVLTVERADDPGFDSNPVGNAFTLAEWGAEDSLDFVSQPRMQIGKDALS